MTKRRLSLGMLVLLGFFASVGAASAAPFTPLYQAIDLGTLGGPNSAPDDPGISISATGVVVGSADTAALNPFAGIPGYPPAGCLSDPCHAVHAFEWRNGAMTDLGTLGGYNAGIFELNRAGVGAGIAETGELDPQTTFPEAHAAMSVGGRLIDLGTLGGNESWATGINNRGQIAGYASNTTPDSYAQFLGPYPSATQWHAAIWQDGTVRDLGTLGGPDSIGGFLNNRGQAAGESFTSSIPNATTGMPTMDPFRWQDGVMRDLGTLGGTFGITNWMNGRGEVAGFSDLAGDNAGHPFLWNGHRLVDLGTLGGDSGAANWVNDGGEVVGSADVPGSQTHHGFLWTHGAMRDLPPTGGDPCANAFVINSRDQVVGNDTDCHDHGLNAMLWENGSAYNLNSLVAPTALHLNEAFYISPNGEIACMGTLPNGDVHVALLAPAHAAARDRVARVRFRRPRTVASRHAVGIRDARDRFSTLPQRIGQLARRALP
jgi:probable HAF family extracellular repeat protein